MSTAVRLPMSTAATDCHVLTSARSDTAREGVHDMRGSCWNLSSQIDEGVGDGRKMKRVRAVTVVGCGVIE